MASVEGKVTITAADLREIADHYFHRESQMKADNPSKRDLLNWLVTGGLCTIQAENKKRRQGVA